MGSSRRPITVRGESGFDPHRPALGLDEPVAAVRSVVARQADWRETARLVRNVGDRTAISLHVYGTDVSRIGSSVRRYYDQPVLAAP